MNAGKSTVEVATVPSKIVVATTAVSFICIIPSFVLCKIDSVNRSTPTILVSMVQLEAGRCNFG